MAESAKKEETPKPEFLKAKLGAAIFLCSEDLVIKLYRGSGAHAFGGEVQVGISFGNLNEKRITRKLKDLKKTEAEISKEIKVQVTNLLNAYKKEFIEKLEQLGVDQKAVKAADKELKAEELEYLLS